MQYKLDVDEIMNGAKPKTVWDKLYVPGVGIHDPNSTYQRQESWTDEARKMRETNKAIDDEIERERKRKEAAGFSWDWVNDALGVALLLGGGYCMYKLISTGYLEDRKPARRSTASRRPRRKKSR